MKVQIPISLSLKEGNRVSYSPNGVRWPQLVLEFGFHFTRKNFLFDVLGFNITLCETFCLKFYPSIMTLNDVKFLPSTMRENDINSFLFIKKIHNKIRFDL